MKLALITGGSKGLGKALVEKYLRQGYRVLEFSRAGESSCHIPCDFSLPEEAARIIDKSLSDQAGKDFEEIILINNVGMIDPIGPIASFGTESWISHLNVNLTSAVIASGMFIRHFQNHSCRKVIASISSGAAIRAKFGWSLYCAAKAGLEHFSRTLALEQASQKYSITTVIIDPDIIDTEMQEKIRNTDESLFPEKRRFIGFKETGELRSPASVADRIYAILSGTLENGARYSVKE